MTEPGKTNEPDERDERLETAFAECENEIRLLQNRVEEYHTAVSRHDTEKAEEIAKDVARDQEAKRVEKNGAKIASLKARPLWKRRSSLWPIRFLRK